MPGRRDQQMTDIPPQPSRVLLVVHTQIYFPRMLELGRALRDCGRYRPVFYLAYKSTWDDLSRPVQQLKEEGFELSSLCRVGDFQSATERVKESRSPVQR